MELEELRKIIESRDGCFCHRMGMCKPFELILEYIKGLEDKIAELESTKVKKSISKAKKSLVKKKRE